MARLRSLRSPLLLALGAVGALVVAARTVRALVAPPLAWDALTYHLLKSGRFVQSGGFAAERAPDAWGYYAWFPPGSEVVFAWSMLPFHGDDLLAVANLGVWLGCVVAAFGAARSFGADVERAALAALTVGFAPTVMQHLMASYADVALLSSVLLALVFLRRSGTSGREGEAVLAAAALAVCALVKHHGLPVAALGALWLVVRWWRDRGVSPRGALACAAAFAVALPHYLGTWIATGSPVFPITVELGGIEILRGHPQLVWLLDRNWAGQEGSILPFYQALFSPGGAGFGPAALVVAALALVGVAGLLRDRASRPSLAFALAVVAVGFASVHAVPAFHHAWYESSARYVLPAFGMAVVVASSVNGAVVRWLWVLVVACGIALSLPEGWSDVERRAIVRGLLLCGPWCAAAGIAAWLLRRRALVASSVALLLLVAAAPGLDRVRGEFRYAWYEAAASERSWEDVPIPYASAWPIWQHFDRSDRGFDLAVTAGWDGIGHNWFRLPLMGARLQNELHYVPVTADGSVVDSWPPGPRARAADADAWLGRLHARGLDHVVALGPSRTLEVAWMQARPDVFQRIVSGARGGGHHAYRIDRQALAAYLNRSAR